MDIKELRGLEGPRVRTLTEKAQTEYEEMVESSSNTLSVLRKNIDRIITEINTEKDHEQDTKPLMQELIKARECYEQSMRRFMVILEKTRTRESYNELASQKLISSSVLARADSIIKDIQQQTVSGSTPIKNIYKTSSSGVKHELKSDDYEKTRTSVFKGAPSQKSSLGPRSYHSSRTSSSTASTVLIKQKAKTEAARIRLKFVEKEATILRRQAEQEAQHQKKSAVIKADLKLLESKRDLEEAEAELEVMKDMMGVDDISVDENIKSIVEQRTEQYVAGLQSLPIDQQPEDIPRSFNLQVSPNVKMDLPAVSSISDINIVTQLDPETPAFVPSSSQASKTPLEVSQVPVQTSGVTELTKYIMKKDLIVSRLSQFNDKPERYFVWKSSFKNICKELEVNSTEELDLLCRWLGSESSAQANSLRAANCCNETEALHKIWDRLDKRYGAPELVVRAFQQRIEQLPKLTVKDSVRIYELSDLLAELESLKGDGRYTLSLAYLDSSAGINPIVNKLPAFMQGKWTDRALKYKGEYGVLYPPFTLFVEFIRSMAIRMNDPSFRFEPISTAPAKSLQNNLNKGRDIGSNGPMPNTRPVVFAKKTNVGNQNPMEDFCPLHGNKASHNLKDCRLFQSKSVADKKDVILKHGICFKCCVGKHLAKDCKHNIKCENCGSTSHCSAFHREPRSNHGGESIKKQDSPDNNSEVTNKCTQICGSPSSFKGKSCAKTVLIRIFPEGRPEEALTTYAIIDDQSNRSLARSEFFQHFNENSSETEYILSSCGGTMTKSGKRATGYTIESLDRTSSLRCPILIECDEVPNLRHEIPTPAVARHYRHLKDIEQFIPEYNPEAQILLLIGRDMIAAHHILDQRIGSDNEPYAQRLRLGWVIVGETCLGKVHTANVVTVKKTHVLQEQCRESVLKPCPSGFELIDRHVHHDIFQKSPQDEEIGLSQEDIEFMELMEKGFIRLSNGSWSAPLPFRTGRQRLPNNYQQVRQRTENLALSLRRDPTKQRHFLEFMKKIFDNKHAEEAPPVNKGEEQWYLPIFGVYNPKKPSKIRVVFDSSAKYQGTSLNDVLLTGPDLTNNLVGVLLKFRKESIAVTADVEQMFFNFEVHEEHRNMLRFLWFKDNDPAKEIIEYRMRVHVFGNSPSPAVATLGLRKAACNHEGNHSSCDEVCCYVRENFYVDDALVSRKCKEDVVGLIKQTQARLNQGGNIRLHKIASNNADVIASFPSSDLAENISEMDFSTGNSNVHRSLGLSWDVTRDIFTYKVSDEEKSYTKRGLLSTVHSVFDPLGFVAPVILGGRLLMRDAVQNSVIGWDELLPDNVESAWSEWKRSLKDLETLEIPRTFTDMSLEESVYRELHMFSDASKEAIGAVGYLKVYDASGNSKLGFVLGKSKVAPNHGHTIPRLELCAAVLATELSDFITKHLAISLDATYFYTDSQVVLGYVNNKTRRFHVYVGNRVNRILRSSSSSQWNYVPTNFNPADQATRPAKVFDLRESAWLKGPVVFLDSHRDSKEKIFTLIEPDQDHEVQPQVDVLKTSVVKERLGNDRFQRFSSWTRLTSAISRLKQVAASHHKCDNVDTRNNIDFSKAAEVLVLKEVQKEVYSSELSCLHANKPLSKNSSIWTFSPILDVNGLIRVGGRLKHAKLETGEKNPILIPGKHHIAKLLVRHYHEKLYHQGRHFTEGAIRSAGYWITGGKRLINSVLHVCVKCKKLRGKVEHQKMSDLPLDRLTPSPPFTYVGVDAFGPWSVTSRRTRGGIANSKRWAIIFSCLVTRGIHIEVVEELSSSSFINSLRRFLSLRGPVKEFRSDRGTNFVGAVGELGISAINIEDQDIERFLLQHEVVWKFNPPHASHMSGAWERMIGLVRRILDSMLCEVHGKQLTHEVLCTLMAEVCAIVNSRPITSVSSDPDSPTVLSPSTLITQKVNADVEPFEGLTTKDMYKSQWRHVQVLADQFWKKWSSQYLQNLQSRKKWQEERRNLEVGDVILMLDSNVSRNRWPVGVIERVFPSSDGLVRKAMVRVMRDGVPVTYTRPITQLVYLCSE